MQFRTRHNGLVLGSLILLAFTSLLTACNGGGSDDDPIRAQPSPTVQRIEVAPATATIAKGTTQAFTATAILSDNTTQNVTESAAWSSANASVASVSNTAGSKGRATGNNTGTATITATFEGKSASATLTVTPATVTSVQVTPTNPSIAKGTTQAFTATAIFSDATNQNVTDSATWLSSNSSVATVSNAPGSRGVATGTGVGNTTISATFGGASGSTGLAVTPAVVTAVQVTPTNPSVAKGSAQQFVATAVFSDATTQNVTASAAWTSSNTSVATINAQGLASTLSVGTSTIAAAFMGASGSTTLTVTPAVVSRVDVTPANPSVPKGLSQQFVATAVFTDGTNQTVTSDAGTVWSSSDPSIAFVSNDAATKGRAAALKEGAATVSAAFGGFTGTTTMTVTPATISSIQVTPENESLPIGFKQQYVATGALSDGTVRDVTSEVTWISSQPDKATIDNAAGAKGLATGVAAGSTTITALAGPIQDSVQLTVRDAGGLASIEVTPNDLDLPLGRSQPYTATGVFADATNEDLTTQVTWASSDEAVATVSNAAGSQGLVQSVTEGASTISATHPGSMISGSEPLTVVPAVLDSIAITPDPASIPKGRTQQFTAMGTFSNNSVSDITASVTWSSSDTAVATIENGPNDGRATGAGVGTSTITATQGAITDTATLNVTAAVLDSIAVTPPTASIAKGRTENFMATGTFSDGSTMDLTGSATWASSNTSIATVSNAAGSQGRATGLAVGGPVNITASSSGITSPAAELTVTPAELDSIAITPPNSSTSKGLSRQLTATGTFSDGSTQDLTTAVTWASDNPAIAEVSNAAGNKGLLTANSVGTTIVRATDSGKVGTTNATVTAAAITGLSVAPQDATLPNGFSLQYTATAHFSDGTTQNVTGTAVWSSGATAVAEVSNAAGSKGLVTARSPGLASITANLGGFNGSTLLTVSNETLSSIDVTPKNVTNFASGATLQYTANGIFSGGTTLNLTTQVTWASSNTGAATISNAAGSQGRATAGPVPAASTTISAARAGKTGSTSLTRGVP